MGLLSGLLSGIGKKTATGRTFKVPGGRRFGSYKPRGGGARIFRSWKPKGK